MRTEQLVPHSGNSAASSTNFSNAVNIVRLIKQGKTDAETELIRKYQRGLRFLVRNCTDDDELAKEIVQDTFLAVRCKNGDSFSGSSIKDLVSN